MDNFWQNWKSEKKSTGLSENDKIEHFWQNWRIEKIHGPLTKLQKLSILEQNWRCEKIHGPLTKWQNGAFLTKLKKRKNQRSSHEMTKLSIFDKIEEAKKSTVLLQNDKFEHFWQNLRREKHTRAFSESDKI